MAVTAISDVFVPQVIGDIATNILFSRTPLLQSGVVENLGNTIYADGGNTITLPYFDTDLSIVQDNPGATRTGVTPSKISMGTYTEDVSSKIISIDFDKRVITDTASKVDWNSHVALVVAKASAKSVQDSLVLSAEETDLIVSTLAESTKTLTVDAIATAKMKRGENVLDSGTPILFAHSLQILDLMKTSDFKTLASAATAEIVKLGAPPPGTIGIIHGCWLIPMDSIRHQNAIPAISGITRSSAVATVTTASAHGLRVGDYVTISGATETEYNGTFAVATVPTTATFTYAVTGTPDSPATGTPVFTPNYSSLLCSPMSLGLYVKQELEGTPKDVHAGTTVMTFDFDFRWARTLKRVKPRGVVRLFTR